MYPRRLGSKRGRETLKLGGDVRGKMFVLAKSSEGSIWIGSIWESPGMESKVCRVIALTRDPLLDKVGVVVWVVA